MSHQNRNKIRNWPEFLKQFRQKNILSQRELADLLQIALSYVEKYEAGVLSPPPFLKKALQKIEDDLAREKLEA